MNQMEIKISFDASIPSNVEALNVFLKNLAGGGQPKSLKEIPVSNAEVVNPLATKKAVKKENPVVQEESVKDEPAKESPKKEDVSSEDKITLDLIRPLLQSKVQLNRDAIKEKLSELGASNATSLGEEHYPEFYQFLSDL